MLSLNEQNPFFSVHSPGDLQKSLQALLWSFLEVKAESSGFNQLWFQVDCEQYYLCMHSLYISVQIFTGYWEPSCKEYRILHLYDHAILGISVSAPSSLQGVLGGSIELPKKKWPVFSYQNLNLSKISSAGERSCLSTTKLTTPLIIKEQIYFINTVLYNLWKGYKAQKRRE